MEYFGYLASLFTGKTLSFLRVAALFLIGLPAVYFFSKWIRKIVSTKVAPQPGMVLSKCLYYTGIFIIIVTALHELGFKLNTLLGAAGIVGIAVGFASQTSVSNIISGIFIMMERPFVINDFITVDSVTGQVLSIDMLSIKLRTEDNRFLRIPNETIIKTRLTNITRFPIRRVDIRLGIAYKEDIRHVRAILTDIAHANPVCLQEPEPQVVLSGFGPSSVDFIFMVWATTANLTALQNTIHEDIKERFDQEGIEMPFPHISLSANKASEPLPVRIIAPG
jgi:small-conductance mechanosensitive channel